MDDTEWSDWSESWYEDADLYSQWFHFENGYDGIDAVVQFELDYENMFENTFIPTQQTSTPLCNVDIDQLDNFYDKIDTLIEYDTIYRNALINTYNKVSDIQMQQELIAHNISNRDEDAFDDLDDVPLSEWIQIIANQDAVDPDKTMDYTIYIEEQQNTIDATKSTNDNDYSSSPIYIAKKLVTSTPNDYSSAPLYTAEKVVTSTPSRDKGWKRRGKQVKRGRNLKRKKPNNIIEEMQINTDSDRECNSTNEEDSAVKKAKEISRQEIIRQKHLLNYHTKRLDKILASNMLKRQKIMADGNCLLRAVLNFLDYPLSVQELRSNIANHIYENAAEYITFVTFSDNLTPEEELEQFMEMVEEIGMDSRWNTYMADFVPLCIANLYQRIVRIFSSRPNQPMVEIKPHINTLLDLPPILVAHIAVNDLDHYDAVVSKTANETDSEETIQSDQDCEAHRDAEQIEHEKTPSKQRKRKVSPLKVTPHKDASYISPKHKCLSRKRRVNRRLWKANIRKEQRSKGQEYISKTGKTIKAKSVKTKDCSKCRFKCNENITEDERQSIFRAYWSMGDYTSQRQFICGNVENKEPAKVSKRRKKQRTLSNSFFFSVDEKRVRVCKQFFLKTLDIGTKTVATALKQKVSGLFVGTDMRGKAPPGNKTSESNRSCIKEHIESFPTVDSHYTRKDSNRKYLTQDLSIREMHQLYVEKCKEENRSSVTEPVYRNIFCAEYNLSFFHPKKDQCPVCNHYDTLKMEDRLDDATKTKYQAHQQRKEAARKEKENDKQRAKKDKKLSVSAFDLQAVLTTPCSLIGELYYKRKLCCYNLSFYNLGNGNGSCYLWDETQGKRGSCEVGTCVFMYVNSVANKTSGIEEVTLYSDTCGGQNRNQFVASCLVHCLQEIPHLKTINQKFLESGHSEMECDSIHASIEHAKIRTKVHVPSQWETVITLARRKKPYVVIPIKYNDIKDYKMYKNQNFGSMKTDLNGERVNWLSIKWIQVRKDSAQSIFVNYGFDPNEFKEIILFTNKGKSKEKALKAPQNAYKKKLPISAAKKADLLSLVSSGTIPREYGPYYQSLPSSKSVKDKLPMPSVSESEDDMEA